MWDDLFAFERDKLHRYFAGRSHTDEVAIHPVQHDVATYKRLRSLYEERLGSRAIQVHPGNGVHALDACTKLLALQPTVTNLVISSDLRRRHLPIIWECYVKWIHKGADEAAVLSFVGLYQSQPADPLAASTHALGKERLNR